MKNSTVLLTSNLYRPFYGGIENSLFHLAGAFRDRGFRVIVCASDLSPPGLVRPSDYAEEDGVIVQRYRVQNVRGSGVLAPLLVLWNLLRMIRCYRSIKRQYKPELTVVRFHLNAIACGIAGLKNRQYLVPGVAEVQNSVANFDLGPGLVRWARYQFHHWVQVMALSCSSRVLVFSRNMVRQLRQLGFHRRVWLTRPGVDPNRFAPGSRALRMAIRSQLGCPHEAVVFLCVGRMVKAKGFDLAIEALSSVGSLDVELWLVGDGPEEEALFGMAQAVSPGSRSRIRFLGRQSEPAPFFAASDFFVMSSRYEPLGQTVLEAMASGLPVLAFRADSDSILTATEELVPKDLGFYCDESSAEGLSSAMELAARLPSSERSKMAEKLVALARHRFSWDALVTDLLSSEDRNQID